MIREAGSLTIIQNCWVVADLDRAMAGWLALRVGPFIRFDVEVSGALYRGRPVPLTFSVACAQAGGIQIELIDQRSDGPSAYRDTVAPGDTGFHHVCRTLGRYDETVCAMERRGIAIATAGVVGDTRFCYADTRAMLGCMLEIVDETPTGKALNAMISDAAESWDGRDPVRDLEFSTLFSCV